MGKLADKTVLITGANRGLGFECAKQMGELGYHVLLTARNTQDGEIASDQLRQLGIKVSFHALDVANETSLQACSMWLYGQIGHLDVLINNAGVFLDHETQGVYGGSSALDTSLKVLRDTMEVNVYGVLRLCQEVVPLMKKQRYGRIVNVSSGMGQLTEMNGGYPAYRISKASLNAITRMLADELESTNILVNSVCPGWVKTRMGGENATLTPKEGVDTMVWLATLPDSGPSGGFFRERQPIPW